MSMTPDLSWKERYERLEQDTKELRSALNDIASWDEGDLVTGSFDEPFSAQKARNALDAARTKKEPSA